MTPAETEQRCLEIAQRLSSRMGGSGQAELDPETIRVWAELIFSLLERCIELRRSGGALEQAARSPSMFERLRVRGFVRRKLGYREFRARGDDLVEAIFAEARESGEGELAVLADAVGREVGG